MKFPLFCSPSICSSLRFDRSISGSGRRSGGVLVKHEHVTVAEDAQVRRVQHLSIAVCSIDASDERLAIGEVGWPVQAKGVRCVKMVPKKTKIGTVARVAICWSVYLVEAHPCAGSVKIRPFIPVEPVLPKGNLPQSRRILMRKSRKPIDMIVEVRNKLSI
jgi:hypothetical protein